MEYPKLYSPDDANLTQHPFILDLGNPTAVVASNALANKVGFYSFKEQLEELYNQYNQEISNNLIFAYFEDKVRYQKMKFLFSNFGILFDKKSGVIDRAIELGLALDYETMLQSYEDTMLFANQEQDDFIDFFKNMSSLVQICELKALEGKLLQIFSDQIERENGNGDISTLSAIQNSTAILYYVIQTPYAFFGKHSLHDEVKKLYKMANKNLSAKGKIQLLSQYANLPLVVYKNTMENMMQEKEDIDEKEIDEYYEKTNDSITDVIDTNALVVNAVYEHFFGKKEGENEQNFHVLDDGEIVEEYVAQKDFVDPSIQ